MANGSRLLTGVREEKFLPGQQLCDPPSAVIGTAGGPVKVNGEGPLCARSLRCVQRTEREGLSAGIPPLVPNTLRGVWQDPGGWLKAGTGTFDKYYD